jgi:hypothetical protein
VPSPLAAAPCACGKVRRAAQRKRGGEVAGLWHAQMGRRPPNVESLLSTEAEGDFAGIFEGLDRSLLTPPFSASSSAAFRAIRLSERGGSHLVAASHLAAFAPCRRRLHRMADTKTKRVKLDNTAAPAEPTAKTLVARLLREDLECLLIRQIDDGSVSRDEVLALLPASCRSSVVAKRAPVGVSAARTGTGFFDEIDDAILVPLILARLPTRDRLTCAMAVCKSWRNLHEAEELWSDIEVDRYTAPRDSGFMDGPRLQRLVAWLHAPSAVTTFAVDTGESISPEAVKRALTAFSSLTSLSLSGKKITDGVLTHLSKQPATKCLVSLTLSVTGSTHEAAASKLLSTLAAPLRELSISGHLAQWHMLDQLSRTLRASRHGGSPLLNKLALTSSFGRSTTWASISRVGPLFPELESLEVASLADDHYGDDCTSAITGMIRRGVQFSIGQLPRLRHLIISELAGFTCNMSSEALEVTFKALFVACPSLEFLSVKHGQMWSGGSNPKPVQPLPVASYCFNELPSSLHTLHLTQITLTTEAFASCHLPYLRHASFRAGGLQAQAVMDTLLDACPKMTAANAIVMNYGYSRCQSS